MNRFLKQVNFERATTPAHRPGRIYYLTQVSVAPPTFLAFTHRSGPLHFSLERFLENRIREHFDFTGTPLVIRTRAGN
jgi:GTP-binding protein